MATKREASNEAINPYIKRCRRASKAKRSLEPAAALKVAEESEERDAGSSAAAVRINESNRLLSLPGELRNKIYEFVIGGWEAEYESYKRIEIAPLLRKHTGDAAQLVRLNLHAPFPNEAGYAQFYCMKKDWLAPCHASRRLREEYRSLQNTITHAYISVQHLKRYLETFQTVSNPIIATRPVDHPAKMTVFFDKCDKKQLRSFNVLPLMRLMQRAPAFRCDVWTLNPGCDGLFSEPHGIEDRSIHDAVFAAQNSLWAHPDPKFLSSLNRISFSPHGTLSISVKDEALEDWMGNAKAKRWVGADWGRKRGNGIDKNGTWVKERQEHTRKYLEASGMDVKLLEKWKVTVGEEAG